MSNAENHLLDLMTQRLMVTSVRHVFYGIINPEAKRRCLRGGDGDMDNVYRQRRRYVCLAVKERGSDNVSGRG